MCMVCSRRNDLTKLTTYQYKKLILDGIRDVLIAGMFGVWFYSEVLK